MPPKFKDMQDKTFQERITAIAAACILGEVVGVIVDTDQESRYVDTLAKHYPHIGVMDRFDGPGKGVRTIKFRA